MNIFLDEHKDFIIQLYKHQVDFILIGGYAVIFHGYIRATQDMDLWLKPSDENKYKLIHALRNYGVVKKDLEKIEMLNFGSAATFHIGKPPYRIDFLTKVSGLNYEESYKQSVMLPLGKYNIPVLHLHHLVTNKLLSDRAKDLADVEELQKIQKLKRKK